MKTAPKATSKSERSMKKKKTPDKMNEDTISETISFVIKGKLTPIKQELTPITNTSLDNKIRKKSLGKVIKKKLVRKAKTDLKEKALKIGNLCKVNTKVQIKTANKTSALNKSKKKLPDPISSQITSSISNITLAPHLTTCVQKKGSEKKTPTKKTTVTKPKVKSPNKLSVVKPKKSINSTQVKSDKKKIIKKAILLSDKVNLPKTKKKLVKKQDVPKPNTKTDQKEIDEDQKTKETIEKLLKQASRVLKTPLKKFNKDKPKKSSDSKTGKKSSKKSNQKKSEDSTTKTEKPVEPPTPAKFKTDDKPAPTKNEDPTDEVKSPEPKKAQDKPKSRVLVKKSPSKSAASTNKKKVSSTDRKMRKVKEEMLEEMPEELPKRARVASLNAMAKVHCLYENETRGNILDSLEADFLKPVVVKREDRSKDDVEVSTRTLRSVPGLRAVGKHWDMTDTTSSSEDNSGYETDAKPSRPKVKKEVVEKSDGETKPKEVKKMVRKRRRNQTELFMDLKDMVVRKRMASLNATAILAASYSTERRSVKSPESENSYGDTDTESEEYISTDEELLKKKCFEDDVKKEEKLIEVHTTPNKKVAVILNQDTDVTITGVYVNSTTRSTHHEGYCSIAGMQYRISATSHTQTAATAVATETLLQSATQGGPAENSNSESLASSKSYTPLDALSNMQPPPGPGIHQGHHHAVVHGPPHVLHVPPAHQLSPKVRHGCSSAFSSPHGPHGYPPPTIGHHGEETGYVHGYYQPAGPLITVPPHAHGGAGGPQPPPVQITKSAPLSDASPNSSSPPPPSASTHLPPPAPPSSNGDSSDSEVIITSVTMAKDALPPAPPAASFRFQQYPSTPPSYAYSYSPYPYPTPPPPTPPYAHHDLCYTNPYLHHKYPPPPAAAYRRYLPSTSYYTANPPDVYPPPPAGSSAQTTQQVVSASTASSGGSGFQSVGSGAPQPPPPTIIETYSGPPPPALVETYQPPPPPPHYYASAYGPPPPPPPSCYTHSPSRAIPYINATYQSCPCPMQSCPKNVLTGPLTGDGKRSSNITKDSMPLPPVALALPLEPASATGPPSPARGSAGMPPPPSPAGATYQTPPVTAPAAPKEEARDGGTIEGSQQVDGVGKKEEKRKARIGKAMVRNDMRMNTTLLMCNPVNDVKREIESPQEKVEPIVEEQKECPECPEPEETKVSVLPIETPENDVNDNHRLVPELKEEKELVRVPTPKEPTPEPLQPCISTVAENVKVKNMKRKMSLSSECVPEPKKIKPEPSLSAYKSFIKKDPAKVKITNGKKKLLTSNVRRTKVRKQVKVKAKPKARVGARNRVKAEPADAEVKRTKQKKNQVNSKIYSKSEEALCDKPSKRNSVDEVIESVVCESRTFKKCGVQKLKKEPAVRRGTNVKKTKVQVKTEEPPPEPVKTEKGKAKIEVKKAAAAPKKRSKSKEVVPEVIQKIPRRSSVLPKWSNGWTFEGEPYEGKVFLNSDETIVQRLCYPAIRHTSGDLLQPKDCVLLKAGPRRTELPYVAKIAALWKNPEDGEMMMSLLWYYRPEHTEQGRGPADCPDEVFASRHKDSNSVACIDDKCYVLTFNEYCRYRKEFRRLEEGVTEPKSCMPSLESYPRENRQPPDPLRISPEMVFFCRRVYDFRQKRMVKNPT